MKTKTKYIGAGTTILTIGSLILWMALSSDFSVEFSGDVECEGTIDNPCISYINATFSPVSPVYGAFYIRSKDEVKLSFSPDISDYALCKKDGRYKKARALGNLCGPGYREVMNGPYTSRYSYWYKFDKNVKHEWMLVGLKLNPKDNVKWGMAFSDADIDPVWKAISNGKKDRTYELCKLRNDTVEKTVEYPNYVTINSTCSGMGSCTGTYPNGTQYITETVERGVRYVKELFNVTVCDEIGVVQLKDKTISYDNMYCKVQGDWVVCYSYRDGRGDHGEGRLKSGESGEECYIPTGACTTYDSIKKGKIEKLVNIEEYNEVTIT